ncbi:MAG: hypothetical protein R3254_08060 [Thiomicrorhabdus sp.]|nr:hypothetical protein [Thiomicrorhabdus sp.]
MKKQFIALVIGLVAVTTLNTSFAGDNQAKPSAEFFKQLNHASFMPNLMKHIMHTKGSLKLSKEQINTLKEYKKTHSPQVHKMVETLIEVEKQAKQMALDNYPPEKVAGLAKMSLDIRSDIFHAKLKCRSFVKSVLSEEQYKKALTSYK